MHTYVILLRGINVGGKNKVPMADLKKCLEDLGCSQVTTYIASGNAIVASDKTADTLTTQIEKILPEVFTLDSQLIKVLILSPHQLQRVIDNKPKGFGEYPNKYHSDVLFLMGIDASQVMQLFHPRKDVDTIWPGERVIYSQRLSAMRTKSRLNSIMGTPAYKAMTIRNWNTTTKLLELATLHREGWDNTEA